MIVRFSSCVFNGATGSRPTSECKHSLHTFLIAESWHYEAVLDSQMEQPPPSLPQSTLQKALNENEELATCIPLTLCIDLKAIGVSL